MNHATVTLGDGSGQLFDGGSGRPVVLLHEWWGVVPAMLRIAERVAQAGHRVLVVDLYRGQESGMDPGKAASLMDALALEQVLADTRAAVDLLLDGKPGTAAVLGYSMGGQLAMEVAVREPRIDRTINFYGKNPDPVSRVGALAGPVQVHYAALDGWVTPDERRALASALSDAGGSFEIWRYPNADHSFCNEDVPAYDEGAAQEAMARVVRFIR